MAGLAMTLRIAKGTARSRSGPLPAAERSTATKRLAAAGPDPDSDFFPLVAQLSSRFARASAPEVDGEITAALQRISGFFQLDRCALFEVDHQRQIAHVIHQDGRPQERLLPSEWNLTGAFPWLYATVVQRGETVSIDSLQELPPAAARDAEGLRRGGVRSALLIALPTSPMVEYVLALASNRAEHRWTAAQTAQLRLLGEVFAAAIRRKALEDGRSDARQFEQMIAHLLARFGRAGWDQLDQQVQAMLEELLAFAQVDHFGFFTVDQNSGCVQLTYSARAEGVPPVPTSYNLLSGAPWLYERLVRRGETFSFGRLDEFPPAAAADRSLVESRGSRSGLYIPLQVEGKVRQILAVVTRAERSWPSRFIERLQVLGEVIVTAINQKSIAAERLRSESNLAEAQRIANLGSWEWDIARDKITTSEQCNRIQGLRIARFDDLMAAIHPDDRDAVRRKVEQDMVPPYTKGALEYRIRRPDGRERFVRDVYEFVLADDGTPARVIGTIQDITEQTLMRQQLRWAQQFAQSTLNAFHDCLCVLDATGHVVEVSDGWAEFAQTCGAAELVTGADFFGSMERTEGRYAAQAKKLLQGVRAVLRGEQEEFAMESLCEGPAGRRFFASKVTRFSLEGATYAGISHEDITQRKSGEEELHNLRTQHWHNERVTRAGMLIASLAHELSQPLTAILSNAQAGLRFLVHEEPDLKEFGEIFKDIASDGKRAGEIIESLRVLLRRQQSERAQFDVAVLAAEVAVLLKSELVTRQVELDCDYATGCMATVNRGQIQQVLLNLMMNGIEAMASKSAAERRMRIGVRSTGQGMVHVSVRDSGTGITQEEFKKVFDAFWTTKARGTGLGLAISRSIVESHGGRIWVDSQDGVGSTFFVSLPEAGHAGAAAGGKPASAPAQ